jgi:protein FRG1
MISLRYQARGGRKYVGTEEDKKDLKRAKREGKLSEATLDRRTKLKR